MKKSMNISLVSLKKKSKNFPMKKSMKNENFACESGFEAMGGMCEFGGGAPIFRGTMRLLRNVDFFQEGIMISKILSESHLWGVRTPMQMHSPAVYSLLLVYKSFFELGLFSCVWGYSRVQENRGLLGTQKHRKDVVFPKTTSFSYGFL